MPKKIKPLSFDEVISRLRSQQFDVQPALMDSKGIRVSKYNCAAELGPDANDGAVLLHSPGILLGGEIALLMDRGFQKFFKTSRMEVAATAERLKAEHRFSEELTEATGGVSLYNKSLGTTSDRYMYDRLNGRNGDRPARGMFPWAAGSTGAH